MSYSYVRNLMSAWDEVLFKKTNKHKQAARMQYLSLLHISTKTYFFVQT